MNNKIKYLIDKKYINDANVFSLVLGKANDVLPGGKWSTYYAVVNDGNFVCYGVERRHFFRKKVLGPIKINYSEIDSARFYKDNDNIWLKLTIEGNMLPFTSPIPSWKSPQGKKFVEEIKKNVKVEGLKEYQKIVETSINV